MQKVKLKEQENECFYHNADLDGKCSAAIVRYVHPAIELVGINYGDPFPWNDCLPGETIYMVDFSLQPIDEMIRLANIVNLVWIDHHKTSIDDLQNSGHSVRGIQKTGIGACALVWDWFLWLLGRPTPNAVRLLAEYDVWNHSDPLCLPFQYGMREIENDPGAEIWRSLLSPEPASEFDRIVSHGQIIVSYETTQSTQRIKALAFETELDGLKVIAINHGLGSSKLFDSIWDPNEYDAMLTFVWRSGQWTISLYSDKDGVDVGAVAKARGGGGHVGAAGFQCEELPTGFFGRNSNNYTKGEKDENQ